MKKTSKNFNIVIVGIGGQGQITLLRILSKAALEENYDVKTSELHGLSQRGGSVEVHCRFGKRIYSPLVPQAGADLLIGLEMQEVLRGLYYVNSQTKILANEYISPVPGEKTLSKDGVLNQMKDINKNITLVPATEICQKEFGNPILAGVYLLGQAISQNLIPLKIESLLVAIKKIVPEQYLESNLKAFELSQK